MSKQYIEIIKNIYTNALATIHNNKDTTEIKILKGVRQGDNILQEIVKRVEWSEDRVNVNGRNLNHLRFADDIVLISNNTNNLQARLQELHNSSKISGMKMNMNKTKVMFNTQIFAQPIYIEEQELEKVDDYVYLGHTSKMDNNIMDEVKNRT